MEIKREPKIKSMKYEDFNDNEYLEKMVAELRDNNTKLIPCFLVAGGVVPHPLFAFLEPFNSSGRIIVLRV